MISEHESLEVGDGRQRCQVVRWVRTFPFSFLSKREYIIGRRMWRGPDGCLFGITKVCTQTLSSSPLPPLPFLLHRHWNTTDSTKMAASCMLIDGPFLK